MARKVGTSKEDIPAQGETFVDDKQVPLPFEDQSAQKTGAVLPGKKSSKVIAKAVAPDNGEEQSNPPEEEENSFSEETAVVETEGTEGEASGGEEAAENKQSPSPGNGEQQEETPKRKGWGEVMILEEISVPVDKEGKERVVAWMPLAEWVKAMEQMDNNPSSAEAEKWLTENVQGENLPFGTFMIVRRVKTIRLQEVRQVVIQVL